MASRSYNAGVARALSHLGLTKTAADDGVPTSALAAGGVIAATPFAGLIGEKPMIHSPFTNANIPKAQSLEELAKQMRPGDVLVTSRPGMGAYKTPQTVTTGSSFYHAVPVIDVDPKTGRPRVLIESDAFHDYKTGKPRTGSRARPWDAAEALGKKYPEVVLLRPNERMTPEQLKRFQTELLERAKKPYDSVQAVKNWLKDVFIPKFNRGPGSACKGSICSTGPSQAMYNATGTRVVPNKAVADLLPADFLRSEAYTAIGAHVPKSRGLRFRRATRLGGRGLLGALLGGGAILGANALLSKS